MISVGGVMLIVQVHVRVKPEFIDDFTVASVENARHSIQEPGIARGFGSRGA